MNQENRHPSFLLAEKIPEPWRSHFPKSQEEAATWNPFSRRVALASRVLVVCQTRVECAWAAYIDAVEGHNHDNEWEAVLEQGVKLPENVARILFSDFEEIPYAP